VVVLVGTPLAPRPASCRVVAAPRLCKASRAGVRIIIPRACQALCTSLSVLPPMRRSLWGSEMQKDGFTGLDSWEVAAVDRPSL